MNLKNAKVEGMNPLWTNQQISEIFNVIFHRSWQSFGVSIDSRTINDNDIFFAIEGENFDAHDYLNDVFAKGAVIAFVQRIPEGFDENDERLVLVDNTLTALQKLAKYRRDEFKGKIIGITGSVGKTTTKEMVACALSGQGKIFATQGNFNNHIGLPLCLARMEADCDYGVFEMGMSAKGEIAFLGKIARPDVTIITNVENVHLEFFESLKEIAEAKSEIFENLNSPSVAILNANSHYFEYQLQQAKNADRQIIYGEKNDVDFQLVSVENENEQSNIKAKINGKELTYKLKFTAKHHAINSLGVLACVSAVGANLELAAKNLFNIEPKNGRGKSILVNKNNKKYTVIDDCYNASPISVTAAIIDLGKKQGRKIAILGDMFELGKNAKEFHKELASYIINSRIDKVFTVGNLMKNLFEALPNEIKSLHCDNSDIMKKEIFQKIQDSDVILIKGSRGMRMEKIVKEITEN